MSTAAPQPKGGIFICTPCYGGMLTYQYVNSLIQTYNWTISENVPLGLYLLGNESLIPRGRNRCAAEFLKSNCQKLLFVDSDLSWTEKDVWRLYHSPHLIVGGTYPIKTLPISLNFNPLLEHEKRYFPKLRRSKEEFALYAKECADGAGEVEVRHLATGFLMIDRSVLLSLREKVPAYASPDMTRGTVETHHEFFAAGARDGNYESEDWNFCRVAIEHGYRSWLQTQIVCPHTGTFTFDAERFS